MSRLLALKRISEVTQKVHDLQTQHARLEMDRQAAIQKADDPFSKEVEVLCQEADQILQTYTKLRDVNDDQLVKLNKKREKARQEVRKPFDRSLRKTTNEIDNLINEAKDLADEHDVVVHFDDGTIYDPSNDGSQGWDPSSRWYSSSC